MHCVAFLSKSKFSPFLIVMHESLNCPQFKNMDFKIIQLMLERVQICRRCWKTKDWRIFLKNSRQNCSGPTRDS